MSVIFDAMLVAFMNEDDAIEALNKALDEKDTERHQSFERINMDGAGGSKFFTTYVYAAAFNHLAPGDVEECICAAPWRYPRSVLYVMELGDYFHGDYDDTPLAAQTVEDLRAAAQRTEER